MSCKKYLKTNKGMLSKDNEFDWICWYNLYLEIGSLAEVSRILGIGDTTLARYFRKFNFKLLSRGDNIRKKLERSKKTNLEKYGVENPFQADEVKDKIKKTNLEKYGVEYASQSEEVKNKIKETSINKYGMFHTKSKKIKDKIKKTNLEKYGVTCLLCDNNFRINNIMDKYGVENPFQADEVKDKIKKTNLEKYGVEYASQSEEVKNKIRKKYRDKMISKLEKDYGDDKEYSLLDKYVKMYKDGNWYRYTFRHNTCGLEFKRTLRRDIKCPKCYYTKSKEEVYIKEYLDTMNIEYVDNVRNLIKNPITGKYYELDFYFPEYNFAIEYNGYPFHIEKSQANEYEMNNFLRYLKEDGYHDGKNKLCVEQNIKLYNIWYYEDTESKLLDILEMENII